MLKLICKFDYKEKEARAIDRDGREEKKSGEEVIENNKCKD
jgi:hypothetical protein